MHLKKLERKRKNKKLSFNCPNEHDSTSSEQKTTSCLSTLERWPWPTLKGFQCRISSWRTKKPACYFQRLSLNRDTRKTPTSVVSARPFKGLSAVATFPPFAPREAKLQQQQASVVKCFLEETQSNLQRTGTVMWKGVTWASYLTSVPTAAF